MREGKWHGMEGKAYFGPGDAESGSFVRVRRFPARLALGVDFVDSHLRFDSLNIECRALISTGLTSLLQLATARKS